MVVIGGFIEKTIVDVESLMEEMTGIAGYKDKEVIGTAPPIALAHFDSPERARSQKKNDTIHANKLLGFGKQVQTRETSMQNGL